MGDVETDKDDRPLEPPRLNSVEVLLNPFDDIVPRNLGGEGSAADAEAAASAAAEEKKKRRKKQGKKDFKLLSFGDEADEEEKELEAQHASSRGVKSAHDALDDEKFSKDLAYDVEALKKAGDWEKDASAPKEGLRKAVKTAAKGAANGARQVISRCMVGPKLRNTAKKWRVSGGSGGMRPKCDTFQTEAGNCFSLRESGWLLARFLWVTSM